MSNSDHVRYSINKVSQTREEICNDKSLTFWTYKETPIKRTKDPIKKKIIGKVCKVITLTEALLATKQMEEMFIVTTCSVLN